jgi:hypothetical protein
MRLNKGRVRFLQMARKSNGTVFQHVGTSKFTDARKGRRWHKGGKQSSGAASEVRHIESGDVPADRTTAPDCCAAPGAADSRPRLRRRRVFDRYGQTPGLEALCKEFAKQV